MVQRRDERGDLRVFAAAFDADRALADGGQAVFGCNEAADTIAHSQSDQAGCGQDHRIEVLGDRLEQLLENGVIDDAQYDALQAELDEHTRTYANRPRVRRLTAAPAWAGAQAPDRPGCAPAG